MRPSPISTHKGQQSLWRSTARFNVCAAGRRFGKTFFSKEKLAAATQKKKGLYWYIAPTRSQAKDLIWDELKDTFRRLKWRFHPNEQDLEITRISTGAKIRLKSADKVDRLRGKGLDGAILDEFADFKKEAWTECLRPALSDKRGWADFLGTPKGFNHFYELHQEAKTRHNWASFHFKTIDSPYFQTPEGLQEIEDARLDLDERAYRQEYEASFESFSGRICYAFDRAIHNSLHVYDKNLSIYVGQDFNRNPMAGVLFQLVAGRLHAFQEMVVNTSSTDEICEKIKREFPHWQRHGVIFRPDATGKRRTSNSSRSDHQIIKDHGFIVDTANANPARIDRWQACNRSFERDQVLINVTRCPVLAKELETLAYKEGTCEPDIKEKSGHAGHVFDAFGYCVYKEFPIIKQGPARTYGY